MGCVSSKEINSVKPSDIFSQTVSTNDFLILKIQEATYDNTQPFTPLFTNGKCVKVYDGDTIHIAAIVNGDIYRFTIRLYGYDSPEIRSKNAKEKEAGYKAKNALSERIEGKMVNVLIHPIKEKFGRILATISDSKGEVNKWMIENGYGIPYFGGSKEK